ncbi:hypothetical protein FE251_02585 [Georgenia wutianyii]|uniref:HTTM domain-containing protein n=1 Tax=Georgenia wutianyii TaxID=2585135 RepID=A0ABX5VPA9_9MICO|nr:hypothetical protein [Georgenia wutianyii]QDB78385.1 hypothetical protein FE251_02585 [Georgenia wutianyii]
MRAVAGWLTRPVPLARVAAFRALVYAFVIWDVLFTFDDVIPHSYVPELYQPTLLARLVHLPPLSTAVSYALLAAILLLCVLAIAGRAQRVAGWGVALTFWVWALNSQGFSYVQHDHMALMVTTLALPTVGVAHYRDQTLSQAAGWALRCVQLATVLTYFGSVFAKWSRAGSLVTWANGSVLTWAIVRRGSHLVQWALEYPMLLRAAQWGSLVLEICSPVVLFMRGRWLYLAIGCFLAFHLATFIAMGIHFLPTVVCWFAFLPLERVTERVSARLRLPSPAPA